MASGGVADPFLARLNGVKDQLSAKFAKALDCDPSLFKVIVTSHPDKGIYAGRFKGSEPHYYTVALMLSDPTVIGVSRGLAAIIEKVTITGEPLDTVKQQQTDFDVWKRKQNQEEYDTAAQTGVPVNPNELTEKCHNLVKLQVIPPQSDKSPYVGAVLGSWFYYTDERATAYLKKIGKWNSTQLQRSVLDFVYNDIKAGFMMLYDAWIGWNKEWNDGKGDAMTSFDVRKAAGTTKFPLTPGTQKIHSTLITSPEHQSREANKAAISKTGYYAGFGFTERTTISAHDSAFLADETVKKTKLVALSGNDPGYIKDHTRLKISIKPVAISLDGRVLAGTIPLDGEPQKVLGQLVELPRPLRFNFNGTDIDAPLTFYDLIEPKAGGVLELLRGIPLSVSIRPTDDNPVRASRSRARLQGAFADLAIV